MTGDGASRRLSFRGATPTVADSAVVSAQSYLVGDVSVAGGASLWPFVCAREDEAPVTIGAETNVQEFAMLHGARLGERVAVGHGAIVDHATVEAASLVGIRSAALREATIESGCLVAAGAVVRSGQTVPSGHLAYGGPVETWPLSDDQRAVIDRVGDHYVDLAQEYTAVGGLRVTRGG